MLKSACAFAFLALLEFVVGGAEAPAASRRLASANPTCADFDTVSDTFSDRSLVRWTSSDYVPTGLVAADPLPLHDFENKAVLQRAAIQRNARVLPFLRTVQV